MCSDQWLATDEQALESHVTAWGPAWGTSLGLLVSSPLCEEPHNGCFLKRYLLGVGRGGDEEIGGVGSIQLLTLGLNKSSQTFAVTIAVTSVGNTHLKRGGMVRRDSMAGKKAQNTWGQ